jgi:hypothetical protein
MKYINTIILLSLLFFSCEKEIDLKIDVDKEDYVVDGKIENDFPPYLLLSKTFSIYKDLNISDLSQFLIKGAEIWVSNGTDSVQLKEYNNTNFNEIPDSFQTQLAHRFGIDLNIFNGNIPPFINFYTVPFDEEEIFTGELGKTYQLNIKINDKILTSKTTIPNYTNNFDTLWLETHPNPAKFPDLFQVTGILADNANKNDFYRYFTKVDNEPWLVADNSVFDDAFFNGERFKIFIPKGYNFGFQNGQNFDETDGYWNTNDSTLFIKLCIIDKEHYDFWRTLESNRSSQGNPFGSFVVIKSNIKGGMGIWGGYASKTLIFQRY